MSSSGLLRKYFSAYESKVVATLGGDAIVRGHIRPTEGNNERANTDVSFIWVLDSKTGKADSALKFEN